MKICENLEHETWLIVTVIWPNSSMSVFYCINDRGDLWREIDQVGDPSCVKFIHAVTLDELSEAYIDSEEVQSPKNAVTASYFGTCPEMN